MRIPSLPLFALLNILSTGRTARILGIFPVEAKSHLSCNMGVMKSLLAAEHHITMVRPFPLEMGIENFTTIDSRSNRIFSFLGQSTVHDFGVPFGDLMDSFMEISMAGCYSHLNLPVIQEALNSHEKLYDVMFLELGLSFKCFLPIAQKLDIPVIGVVTLHSWKLVDHTIGLPNNPAVIPLEIPGSRPGMTFVERVENLWNNLYTDYLRLYKLDKKIEKVYREYFTEDLWHKKDISLIFYNNHDSLLPRPMPPNAINIGGIHLMPAKPLPEDIRRFIDEASRGVILFSFGSVVKASSLSLDQRKAFLEAFESVPQRVIWKFEDKIENLPKNILLLDWIPQRDILEHKNVIAFMSHCGQSGVYEAVSTGTPVVTIPVFADQFSNAALLLHRQVGVFLDHKTVTKDKVLAALNTIINDTSYHQRMQELSLIFKDRPMSPQESVVYWTEYVIRHNGAPFLRALGTDMPLYKYLMLDIIASAAISIGVAIFILYKVIRKFYALVSKNVVGLCSSTDKKRV